MNETHTIGERSTSIENPAVKSVADLIFGSRGRDDGDATIIHGCLHPPELRGLRVSLHAVRHHVLALIDDLEARGVAPGDTVALLRFARTNETLTALVYLALSAWGVRVLLPMYLELASLPEYFELAGVSHVLGSFDEVARDGRPEDVALATRVRELVLQRGLPLTTLGQDLALDRRITARFESSPSIEHPRIQAMLAGTSLETPSLLLTTSGTSGKSKLVAYTQGGYLRSCAAWEAAGLYAADLLGGRCLNLLLGHSMGLRALWNAVWTRAPVCLITPEWFAEHPERVYELLLEMRPEHITGGPTVFGLLLRMFEAFPDLAAVCARELKCLVSSGAPYDPVLGEYVRARLGMKLHNALGLTETMQVASTVLGGEPPSLGRPLPGVQLRLERDESLPRDAWRLKVGAAFGFSGYLGHPDAGPWFDTGDLVELLDDDTVRFLGRERWDFVNDGVGVKLSRAHLEALYSPLPDGIAAIEYVPLRPGPGLAALAFVGQREGGTADAPLADVELQTRVRAFFQTKVGEIAAARDEFEHRHMAVRRFALLAAEPLRTRKGNIARAQIEDTYASLIANLETEGDIPGFVSL